MSALFLNTDLIEINSFKKQPVAVWEHEINLQMFGTGKSIVTVSEDSLIFLMQRVFYLFSVYTKNKKNSWLFDYYNPLYSPL